MSLGIYVKVIFVEFMYDKVPLHHCEKRVLAVPIGNSGENSSTLQVLPKGIKTFQDGILGFVGMMLCELEFC